MHDPQRAPAHHRSFGFPRSIPALAFEMRAFLFLAVKELRVLVRDRHSLALLCLMPAAFIFLLSYALKDVHMEKAGGKSLLAFVQNESGGELAQKVAADFLMQPGMQLCEWCSGRSVEDLQGALAAGKLQVLVTVARGFPDVSSPAEMRFDPTLDAAWRVAAQTLLGLSISQVLIGVMGQNVDGNAGRHALTPRDLSGLVRPMPIDRKWTVVPTPLQQTVPAWSIFAMFFVAIPLASAFHRERQSGLIARLRTYPVSAATVLLSRMAAFWLLNVLQFGAMLAVGVWLMPLFFGEGLILESNSIWLLPVTLVTAATSTAFGTFVAASVRSHEQAAAVTSTSIIILGVLGGVMVPPFVMPGPMRVLTHLSPLHWSLEAYHDVLLRGAGADAILPKLGILFIFALLFLVTSSYTLQKVSAQQT
jgi:ABC-2 type transport system permease protein